jgi:hypothetical protein
MAMEAYHQSSTPTPTNNQDQHQQVLKKKTEKKSTYETKANIQLEADLKQQTHRPYVEQH